MLRSVHDNRVSADQPPIMKVVGGEFELQTMLQHSPGKTRRDSQMKYLVSWKGYGSAYNSWNPEKSLQQHAGEALDGN